jgi:hypothetical protein
MCGNLVVGVLIQYMSHMKCVQGRSHCVSIKVPKAGRPKTTGRKAKTCMFVI